MINKNNIHQDIVLIVEDTPANHDVIRTFLTDMGISCESAFDGMEAVTKCSSEAADHYSLILMDLNLPHMDGFKTAEALRKLGVTAPIISITATDKNDPRLLQSGNVFNGVLFKPFNASEFFSAVIPYMQNSMFCMSGDASQLRSTVPYDTCLKDAPQSIHNVPCFTGTSSPGAQPFNPEKGVENLGKNRKLFIKHFNNFKMNNADLTLRLSDMLRQGNRQDAVFLCHSIKGLSGMLGMEALQHHIAELEEILKSDTDSTVSSNIVKQLAVISNDLRHICQVHVD